MTAVYLLMEIGDYHCGEPDIPLGVFATLELAQRDYSHGWHRLIGRTDVWITHGGAYRITALPFHQEVQPA